MTLLRADRIQRLELFEGEDTCDLIHVIQDSFGMEFTSVRSGDRRATQRNHIEEIIPCTAGAMPLRNRLLQLASSVHRTVPIIASRDSTRYATGGSPAVG